MIFDQAIAQSCGFCLQGGVQVFSAEGLERRFESGVQQIVISDSVASASLLNQLSMQHENLLFTQSFHLASTSYASLFCSIRRFEMLNTSSSDAVVSCSALLKSMTRYLGTLFFRITAEPHSSTRRATLEKFWFASEMEIKVFVSIVIWVPSYNSQYQILYEGGDAWISNHVQPEQYEDVNVLSAQMQDYFEEKGGTCTIIDENP